MLGGKSTDKMKTVYLDTNIFVTFFLKRNGFNEINHFIEENRQEFDLVTSDWTLTEIVKVLINEYKIKPKKVAEYIEELQREKRIFGSKFSFIGVSKEKGYDFEEFFYHLQKIILQYNNGVSDSIHSLIMKNNNLKFILTTDDKGFQGIKGTLAINPLNQLKPVPKRIKRSKARREVLSIK